MSARCPASRPAFARTCWSPARRRCLSGLPTCWRPDSLTKPTRMCYASSPCTCRGDHHRHQLSRRGNDLPRQQRPDRGIDHGRFDSAGQRHRHCSSATPVGARAERNGAGFVCIDRSEAGRKSLRAAARLTHSVPVSSLRHPAPPQHQPARSMPAMDDLYTRSRGATAQLRSRPWCYHQINQR